MSAFRSPIRRALAAVTIAALAATGALVATSSAQAAPTAPILLSGFPAATTSGSLTVTVIAQPDLVQDIDVWYLEPGVVDVAQRQAFCGFSVAAAPWSGNCSGNLPGGELGEYTLFATADANDGTGESQASANLAVRYGSAAAASTLVVDAPLNSGAQLVLAEPSLTVTGSGAPALGRVEVRGTSVDPLVSNALICAVDPVPVSGDFACAATLPAPTYGQWSVAVTARDVTFASAAAPSGSPYQIVTAPPAPLVGITASGTTLSGTVEGLPGSHVGFELLLNGFGNSTSAGFCPASWTGIPVPPPTSGPNVGCTFFSVPAGVHIVSSGQYLNATATLGVENAVFLPAAPSLTVEPVPGGAVFSGVVSPLADVLSASGTRVDAVDVVVRDAGAQEVCVAAADLATGAWTCTAPRAAGTESFTAIAESVGFADDPDALGSVSGFSDGTSASSASVAATIQPGVLPPAPTMSYSFGPASLSVGAQGLADSAVGVRLYAVDEVPGEGYVYGEAVASCGYIPISEGPPNAPIPTSPSTIDNCRFTGLAPGIWNVYSSQSYYFQESEYRDHYVLIPPAPTISATANAAGQVVARGQGEPGYRVLVGELGSTGSCTDIVGSDGEWSCSIADASGQVVLRAQQQSQGFEATPPVFFGLVESFDGYSAFTAPTTVTVPVAPVTTPEPLAWTLEGYDGGPLRPGQTLSLSAQGLPPATSIVVEIRSTPQVLGTGLADTLGVFSLDVTVPADLEPGEHTLVATATPPGGVASPIAIPVTVVPADPEDDGSGGAPEQEPVDSTADGAGAGGDADRADPAAPSAISDSIPTIDRIFRTPLIAVTAGGLALAILLLVAFPAELLNSTVASNSRRLGRWYAAIEDRVERATEWFAAVTRTRALAAALLVVLTALIFGFVDPDYGFDPVSLRMTVSLAIGLFVVTYVSAWISGAIIQRVWSIPTRVSLQPAALVFAVIGVIVARLLEFSPGFLIGLVIGLDLLTRVDAQYRVRATLTSLGVTVGLALLGWVGFSILSAVMTGEPTVGGLLVNDALVAIAAEGMTAALASLLPLGFLQGHEIFRRSKGLWAGTFVVVATLFALIVLPTASETEGEVADVGFWMLVMVIFAVVTLTLWAVLQFTGRSDDDQEIVEQPVGAAR